MNPTAHLPRILCTLLLLIVVSCSTAIEEVSLEENLEQQELKEKQLRAERIPSEQITQSATLTQLLEKSKVFEASTSSKTVYNPQWGFSVNTEEAMFTTFGDYHSYTFEIFRDNPNGLLENLVISLQRDGAYKSWLIAYDFDDEDYAKIARKEYIAGLGQRASITEIDIEAGIILSDLAANGNDPCKKKEISRATGWTIEIASADCGEGGSGSGGGWDSGGSGDGDWNGASDDPNYPGNNEGYNNDHGDTFGSGSGSGQSDGNGPACFDCNGVDYSTLIYGSAHFKLINRLGYGYLSEESQWFLNAQNKDATVSIVNYLNGNTSSTATQVVQWVMELQFLPDTPCGVGHDCVQSIQIMADGLRKFHGEDGRLMADYFDGLVNDFNSFTRNDLQEFYDLAKSVTDRFNNYMFSSISGAFIEGTAQVLAIVLFEVGGSAVIKLLQKIPLGWVYRGLRLNSIVKQVGVLGKQGFNNSTREVVTNSPITKAKELFNSLTKHAISKSTKADGAIVADMGNGNFITFRPITASQSNTPATISLNFKNIWSKPRDVKFLYP